MALSDIVRPKDRGDNIGSEARTDSAPEVVETLDVRELSKWPAEGTRDYELKAYVLEKGRDHIRSVVAVGFLVILGLVVVWAAVASESSAQHWSQTKEMLQIVLPALTGLIGSVLGFYFGSNRERGR